MKKLILMLMFLLLIGLVFAEEEQTADLKSLLKVAEGKNLPGFLKKFFSDERINIEISTTSGSKLNLGVVTVGGVISSTSESSLENPTFNVYADEATLVTIMNSNHLLMDLKRAIDEKKITYKAIGFFHRLKWGFLSLSLNYNSVPEDKDVIKVKEEVEKIKNNNSQKAKENTSKTDENEVKEDKAEEKSAEVEVEETEVDSETISKETSSEEEEVKSSTVHEIKLTNAGFEFGELEIKKGETVLWKNERDGKTKKALIVGTQWCNDIKSGIFEYGDSFSWKFDKVGTCTIVDGIYTTQLMKVKIS